MKPNDVALRKRTQISHANKVMFIWIAAASALVSFALVTSFFLGQKLIFNEKVLIEKNATVGVLDANNRVVGELATNVRALDADEALSLAKANETDQAIQVILDALPSDANSLALGASLQNKLLAGIPGLVIESLQVNPVEGIESLTAGAVESAAVPAGGNANEITFRFAVSGSEDTLRTALMNLERSIRTIDITSLVIESQGETQLMTVTGRAYYEPAKNVVLYDKVVRP